MHKYLGAHDVFPLLAEGSSGPRGGGLGSDHTRYCKLNLSLSLSCPICKGWLLGPSGASLREPCGPPASESPSYHLKCRSQGPTLGSLNHNLGLAQEPAWSTSLTVGSHGLLKVGNYRSLWLNILAVNLQTLLCSFSGRKELILASQCGPHLLLQELQHLMESRARSLQPGT